LSYRNTIFAVFLLQLPFHRQQTVRALVREMLRTDRGEKRRDLQRVRPARQAVHEVAGRKLQTLESRRRRQIGPRNQVDRPCQEADEAEERDRREQPVGDAGKDQEEARLPQEEQANAADRQDHPEQKSFDRHFTFPGHEHMEEVKI
jgi:hypothetical protein